MHVNDAARWYDAGNVKRGLLILANQRTLVRPKRHGADYLIFLIKVQIVQDKMRLEEEYQRREQEHKDRKVKWKDEHARRDAEERRHISMLHMMTILIYKKDDSGSLQR